MATKIIAAMAIATTLAACAPTVFDLPPGGDQAQVHRDNLQCAMMAKQIVGDQFVMGPPMFIAAAQIRRDSDTKAAHDECMLGKAYTIHQGN